MSDYLGGKIHVRIFWSIVSLGIILFTRGGILPKDTMILSYIIITMVTLCMQMDDSICNLLFLISSMPAFAFNEMGNTSFVTFAIIMVGARILLQERKLLLNKRNWVAISALSFVLYHFLNTLRLSLTTATKEVLPVIAMALISLYITRKKSLKLREFFLCFVIGALANGIYGVILNSLGGVGMVSYSVSYRSIDRVTRFVGANSGANQYGQIMSLGIAFYLSQKLHEKKYISKLTITEISVLVALFILGSLSVSRSFIYASLLLLILILPKAVRKINIVKLIVISLLLIALYVLFYQSINTAIESIDYRMGLADKSGGRIDIWRYYFENMFSSIRLVLFGYGTVNNAISSNLIGCGSHNMYLSTFLFGGFIGCILYFCFMLSLVKENRMLWKKPDYKYSPLLFLPTIIIIFNGTSSGGYLTPFQIILFALSLRYAFDNNEGKLSRNSNFPDKPILKRTALSG